MKLNALFAKDVQRPIEGVIKADDAAHLGTEVDEYVLTNEVAKGLELLLEEYTNYTNANGVWISGFFGSGKSHLLKMLAQIGRKAARRACSKNSTWPRLTPRSIARLRGRQPISLRSTATSTRCRSKTLLTR
jgi:hypothetical protein